LAAKARSNECEENVDFLRGLLKLEQPVGEEATRLRTWLIVIISTVLVFSLFFAVLWLLLDQNGMNAPAFFPSSITLFVYIFGLWLAWSGRIWQSALVVAGWFLFATTGTFWTMPLFGSLVVPLYVTNLIFVGVFLSQRTVSIFALLSLVLYSVLSLFQFNHIRSLADFNLVIITNYLLYVTVFVLTYMLVLLSLKWNKIRSEEALKSEARYRLLFDASPVALWEIDGSEVLAKVQRLQDKESVELDKFLRNNPPVVAEMMSAVRVTDVNETAVSLYGAKDKKELMGNVGRFVSEDSSDFILNSLKAMANRETSFETEMHSPTLDGGLLTVLYRWTIPPNQERVYSPIIASLVDVTARRQVEDALQHYSDRLNNLHELDLAINVKQSPEEIAEVALKFVEQFVPSWGASVWSYDPEGQIISLLAEFVKRENGERPFHKAAYPTASMLSEEIQDDMRGNQTYVVEDLSAMRYLPPYLKELEAMGLCSFMQLPLLVRGDLIGFLNVYDKNANTYQPEFIGIARELATPLAIALANIKLFVAESIARNQAETLRRVAAQLNASLELESLLGQILGHLEEVLPFDSASVFLAQDNKLQVMTQRGLPVDFDYETVKLNEGWLGANQVFWAGEPRIIPDTRKELNWRSLPGLDYIRCWMGIPLKFKEKTIGVLTLDKSVARFYNEKNMEIAVAFANQATIAIENARSHKRAKQYAEDLEKRVNERTRDLTTLYEITAVASAHLELDTILKESLKMLLRTLACSSGTIHILEKGCFHLKSQIGVPDFMLPVISIAPSGNELSERILTESGPYVVRDLAASPYLKHLKLSPETYSFAGVAMQVKNDIVGILSVIHDDKTQFSMEDIALLASVADHFGVVIENHRLRQQNQKMAVLQERERLARELHDSVTQSLYSLTLFAEASRDLSSSGNGAKLREYLDDIGTTAQQALKEMRLMLYELRSSALVEEGLVNALRYRLEAVEGRSGMEANIKAREDISIPPDLGRVLYLVAQEALNNTLKHAKAKAVFVTLDKQDTRLIMTIEDNGQGFSPSTSDSGGMGLKSMRERIDGVDGNFLVGSLPGVGTKIEITVDLEKQGVI
jgi:signal transduction histidine kinase/PAS domain-containing protein